MEWIKCINVFFSGMKSMQPFHPFSTILCPNLDSTPKLVALCCKVWNLYQFEVKALVEGTYGIGIERHKEDHIILHEGICEPQSLK